jgi:hypothetical protein
MSNDSGQMVQHPITSYGMLQQIVRYALWLPLEDRESPDFVRGQAQDLTPAELESAIAYYRAEEPNFWEAAFKP